MPPVRYGPNFPFNKSPCSDALAKALHVVKPISLEHVPCAYRISQERRSRVNRLCTVVILILGKIIQGRYWVCENYEWAQKNGEKHLEKLSLMSVDI